MWTHCMQWSDTKTKAKNENFHDKTGPQQDIALRMWLKYHWKACNKTMGYEWENITISGICWFRWAPKNRALKGAPYIKRKMRIHRQLWQNTIFCIYVNDQCAPMYKHVTYTMFVLVQVDMEVDFQLPRAEETSNIFEIAFSCKCNLYYGSWLV